MNTYIYLVLKEKDDEQSLLGINLSREDAREQKRKEESKKVNKEAKIRIYRLKAKDMEYIR